MSNDSLVDSIANGKILMDLVKAVHQGGTENLAAARNTVRALMGDSAFVDTCATIASFNAVVKIADGTGIPLEDYKEEASHGIREALSINKFRT